MFLCFFSATLVFTPLRRFLILNYLKNEKVVDSIMVYIGSRFIHCKKLYLFPGTKAIVYFLATILTCLFFLYDDNLRGGPNNNKINL